MALLGRFLGILCLAGLFLLTLLVVLVAVLIGSGWLSHWIEPKIVAALEEYGLQVETLEGVRLGAHGVTAGVVRVRAEGFSAGWQQLQVQIRWRDLVQKRLEAITIDGVDLQLDLAQLRGSAAFARSATPQPAEHGQALADDGAATVAAVPGDEGPVERPSTAAQRDIAGELAAVNWVERVSAFPLNRLLLQAARIQVVGRAAEPFAVQVELVASQRSAAEPQVTRLDLGLGGPFLSGDLQFQAHNTTGVVSARGRVNLEPQVLDWWLGEMLGEPMLAHWRTISRRSGIELAGWGRWQEAPTVAGEPAQPSEASLEALTGPWVWEGVAATGAVRLDEAFALVRMDSAGLSADGGLRFAALQTDSLRVRPAVLKFNLRDNGSWQLQSNEVDLSGTLTSGPWRTRVALLGNGSGLWANVPVQASIELSVGTTQLPALRAEPFSVYVSAGPDGQPHFALSALGLVRNGTVWLEEGRGSFDPASGRMEFSIDAFDTLGADLGRIALSRQTSADGREDFSVRWDPAQGASGQLDISRHNGKIQSLAIGESVPLGWLQTAARWWGLFSGRLSGPDPLLRGQLQLLNQWPRGDIFLGLDGIHYRDANGLEIGGIRGQARVLVNGLPRTLEPQTLVIDQIKRGEFALTGTFLRWSLPTLRELEVLEMSTWLDGSARLQVEPFSIDPLAPEVSGRATLNDLTAQRVLDWIQEKRFTLDAGVNGELRYQWQNGQLTLTGLSLKMEPGSRGTFRFVDRDFLASQFASLGNLPLNLEQRLLDALLETGIQLRELSLRMVPGPRPQTVSFRLSISGRTLSRELEFPIGGLVINNVISERELLEWLGVGERLRLDPR